MLHWLLRKKKHLSTVSVLRTVLDNFRDEKFLMSISFPGIHLVSDIKEPDYESILFSDNGIEVKLKLLDRHMAIVVTKFSSYVVLDCDHSDKEKLQSLITRTFNVVKLTEGNTNEIFIFQAIGLDGTSDTVHRFGY